MKSEKETELDVRNLLVTDIAPDPDQPRKEFAPDKLEEMRESIKAHGIVQPLIVRPRRETEKEGKQPFILVAGERRWRGAILAELKAVPAIVRQLDDRAVFAVQMIENLQRENLTALEEAAALQRRVMAGARPDDLAKEMGVSRATVYGRLALTRLEAPVRKALIEGNISTVVAQLVGLVPDKKKQVELLEEVQGSEYGAPLSVREVQEQIEEEYCKALKEAPFDLKDDELVATEWDVAGLRITGAAPIIPASRKAYVTDTQIDDGLGHKTTKAWVKEGTFTGERNETLMGGNDGVGPKLAKDFVALIRGPGPLEVKRIKGGACVDCPFRSGNLPEFPDAAKRPNVCTKPQCYHEKVKAHWVAATAGAKEEGQKVLTATEYKRAKGAYVLTTEETGANKGWHSWQKMVGKHAPAVVLAVTDEGLVKLYPRDEAKEAAKKNGFKPYENNSLGRTKEDRAKEREKRDGQESLRKRRAAFVVDHAADLAAGLEKLTDKESWQAMARWYAPNGWGDVFNALTKAGKARGDRVLTLAQALAATQLVQWDGRWNTKTLKEWKDLGVDLEKHEEAAKKAETVTVAAVKPAKGGHTILHRNPKKKKAKK